VPKRAIKGVITRHIPAWVEAKMYGGTVIQGGVGGQIPYVELYNSSTNGGLIYVWGCNFSVSNSSNCVFEWYSGKHQTAAGGQQSIWSGQASGYGVVGSFSSPTCIGNEFYNLATNVNVQSFWPHNYPCCIISPGYSFGVHGNNANTTLTGGFFWHETPEL